MKREWEYRIDRESGRNRKREGVRKEEGANKVKRGRGEGNEREGEKGEVCSKEGAIGKRHEREYKKGKYCNKEERRNEEGEGRRREE